MCRDLRRPKSVELELQGGCEPLHVGAKLRYSGRTASILNCQIHPSGSITFSFLKAKLQEKI